ncbi:MAG TPA: hypothetical protein VF766_03745, partial [Pyrinomonadaceae bacterium]
MFIKKPFIIACATLSLFAACAREAKQETGASNAATPTTNTSPMATAPKPVRVSAENTDAAEPTVAPAPDGTAYVAWVEHRENKDADVMLAHLDREGQMTSAPVRVNPKEGE